MQRWRALFQDKPHDRSEDKPQHESRANRATALRGKVLLVALALVILTTLALRRTAIPTARVQSTQASSAAPVLITFPNPNIFLSPYNWRVPGDGSLWAPLGGPYLKFSVTGTTSILLNVDTAINSGQRSYDMPSAKVIVDDDPPAFITFGTTASQMTLASGLSPAKHKVVVYMLGDNPPLPDSWTEPIAQPHLQSLQFDAGSTLSPYPLIQSKNCFILGDSFLTGYDGSRSIADPSITWAFQLASVMGCEVGVVGVGGQGFLMPGNGGYPPVTKSWNKYDATHARVFSPPPDFVIDAHGINDHPRFVSMRKEPEAVKGFLKSLRSQLPGAKIFLYLPVGGEKRDETGGTGANAELIKAGFAAAKDPNMFLIDPGSLLVSADNWRTPSWFAPNDGIHPAQTSHGILAAIAIQQMQKALDGSTATPAHPPAGGTR